MDRTVATDIHEGYSCTACDGEIAIGDDLYATADIVGDAPQLTVKHWHCYQHEITVKVEMPIHCANVARFMGAPTLAAVFMDETQCYCTHPGVTR